MELINKFFVQCLATLRAMSPRAQAGAAVCAVGVLAGVGLLLRSELVDKGTYLLGGQTFSTAEITAIQGALGKAQLNDFTVEDNRIRIPRSKQAAYLAALADGNALPQSLTDIFAEATEKTTWLASRQTQIEQARTAKKKALSLILRNIESVESAEVDFDKEEPRGLRQERAATALVAIKLRGGRPLTEPLADYFQSIAGAALNMSPGDVTVVDKTNHVAFGGRDRENSGSASQEYHRLKRKYQAYYEETIRKALADVPGVTVSADVELGAEPRGKEGRAELDANRAAAVGAGQTAALAKDAADPQPGPTSLQVPSPPSRTVLDSVLPLGGSASPAAAPRRPATDPTLDSEPSFAPQRVAISVGIPNSYFQNVWRRQHGGPSTLEAAAPSADELAATQAEEIARIRQHVAPLIVGAGGSPTDQRLTITPFADLSAADQQSPSLGATGYTWAQSPTTVIALGAGGFAALVTVWLISRAAQGVFRKPSLAQSGEENNPPSIDTGPLGQYASSSARTSGRSLRDELTEMVRENPAAAASVLKSWIGNTN